MYADFWFYYHLDLAEMVYERDPALALALIERLPSSSAYYCQRREGDNWRDHLDIPPEYYVLAKTYDAINLNTVASGNFKRKPQFEPWPLPGDSKAKSKGSSLEDIMRFFGGSGRR